MDRLKKFWRGLTGPNRKEIEKVRKVVKEKILRKARKEVEGLDPHKSEADREKFFKKLAEIGFRIAKTPDPVAVRSATRLATRQAIWITGVEDKYTKSRLYRLTDRLTHREVERKKLGKSLWKDPVAKEIADKILELLGNKKGLVFIVTFRIKLAKVYKKIFH